jgi:general nucleoside transport system ATP-binding protein
MGRNVESRPVKFSAEVILDLVMVKSTGAGRDFSTPTGSPILELDGLSKNFGAVPALSDVSLTVRAGEVHCLLGENGAGKSTLCNIVFGFQGPDAGRMRFCGHPFQPSGPAECLAAGIAMVHQHFSVIETMTVVENLMLGRVRGRLRRAEFAEQIRRVSRDYRLEIKPDQLIEDMSVGERQRVEFVKCLIRNPRLLVLDEPTAVLPPSEIDSLLEICRLVANDGCGVILVTHKLAEVAAIADRTTVLRGGRVVESVAMRDADISGLVRAMVGRELEALDKVMAGSLGMEADSSVRGNSVAAGPHRNAANSLKVENLVYRDPAGVARLEHVNFGVAAAEIVGLAGVEGNGQSELADIIAGIVTPTAGHVSVGGRDLTGQSPRAVAAAGVSVVPEDRQGAGCILSMSVAENLFLADLDRFCRFGILSHGAMNKASSALMRDNDIRAAGPEAPMRSLSGGNQQKAILARELSRRPLIFLLAAQPTRGLDVGAVEAVYKRIRSARDNGAGILLISSELTELLAVADRIIVMYRGRIVGECPASSAYREKLGSLMSGQAAPGAVAA